MSASKSGTFVKVVILPLLASLSSKRLQIGMGMLPITTNNSDKFFSRININDFERLWTSKIKGFFYFCDLRLQRTLQDKMAGDRLTACDEERFHAFQIICSVNYVPRCLNSGYDIVIRWHKCLVCSCDCTLPGQFELFYMWYGLLF